MRFVRYVCLFAGLSCMAAPPVEGTWEGRLHGLKAITLDFHESEGQISGTAVFYIQKDKGSGWEAGAPTAPMPLLNPSWDGNVLHFAVSHGDWLVPFEFRVTGPRTAEGKRLAAHGEPEQVVSLQRLEHL